MLDFSFSELLMCFLVALVVLGPEKLPRVARGIGRWTGQARAYMRNLSAELDRESHNSELRKQMDDARRIFDEESSAMKREFRGLTDPHQPALDEHPHSAPAEAAAEPPAAVELPSAASHAPPSIDAPARRSSVKSDSHG